MRAGFRADIQKAISRRSRNFILIWPSRSAPRSTAGPRIPLRSLFRASTTVLPKCVLSRQRLTRPGETRLGQIWRQQKAERNSRKQLFLRILVAAVGLEPTTYGL